MAEESKRAVIAVCLGAVYLAACVWALWKRARRRATVRDSESGGCQLHVP